VVEALNDGGSERFQAVAYSPSHVYEPPRQLTPEEREVAEQLTVLILAGVVLAAGAAAPHVKQWWSEKAAPALVSAWKRITPSRKAAGSQVPVVTSSAVNGPIFVASATGGEVVVAEAEMRMSRAEWEHRFRAMLAAGAFKEEQQRILFNARIGDDYALSEPESAME